MSVRVNLVAARELAALVSTERLAAGAMYPRVGDLRRIARAIAIAVVRHHRDMGFGRRYRDQAVGPAVDRAMWWPEYPSLVPSNSAGANVPDPFPAAPDEVTFDPVAHGTTGPASP
jgi:hypothetical protein